MSTDCSDCVVWDHKCTFLKVFIWYCCCWSGEPTLNIVILEKLSLEFLWMWIHLLLERKVITSWKAETALPIKVCLVKAMVFPVVIYECESWTVKKAEHWRIGAFELWCWRRLLRVPWTARRSTHSILKEISPGCSLEGMMLKLMLNSSTLTTSCEELTNWKILWCWERLGAEGKGDNRGWDGWMASLTRWTWVWVNSGSWWRTGRPGVLWFMGLQRVGHDWATELNWTELKHYLQFHKTHSFFGFTLSLVNQNVLIIKLTIIIKIFNKYSSRIYKNPKIIYLLLFSCLLSSQ